MANDSLALDELTALSPLDGRYLQKTAPLGAQFSEFATIRARIEVEVAWLIHLCQLPDLVEARALSQVERDFLCALHRDFSAEHARRVKAIEARVNHDVKAVEYFIKERITGADAPPQLREVAEFVHFACTSEDINNLACALCVKRASEQIIAPQLRDLLSRIDALAEQHADQPMLARTHGQPASPTTVGKEFANVAHRLHRVGAQLDAQQMFAKFNGASGNFNAHCAAYPTLDWRAITESFVHSFELIHQPLTTQIEPHDWLVEWCQILFRANGVLLDFSRDVWGYVALGYFSQRADPNEVGSSAMPHKINPIDFENAEGNLGLANALLGHFAAKLPISRWQRDLSDSTVLRNLGVAVGHASVAMQSCMRGLDKIQLNTARIDADLAQHWEVLGEAIQTVMRRHGVAAPYEQLKKLTRGARVDADALHAFIRQLELPESARRQLLALTPQNYIGLAAMLAENARTLRADDD